MDEYICGICGTVREDKDGYCINNHDHWVEESDIYDGIDWGRNSTLSPQLAVNLLYSY